MSEKLAAMTRVENLNFRLQSGHIETLAQIAVWTGSNGEKSAVKLIFYTKSASF